MAITLTSAIERVLVLAESQPPEGPLRETWREEMRALLLQELLTYRDPLASLTVSVGVYLDHPGCNNPAKATAMAKLRWAMDEAKTKL